MEPLVFTWFSPTAMIALIAGCAIWVLAYGVVLRNVWRGLPVEFPAIGVAANFAWELNWGFIFGDEVGANLGWVFMWGYRVWFFMDMLIVAALLKTGRVQVTLPGVRRNWSLFFFGWVIFWTITIYTFAAGNDDTPFGTVSAYIDNLALSLLYVMQILRNPRAGWMTREVAWLKMLGTGLVTVAVFMALNQSTFFWFVKVLAATTLAADILYIRLWYRRDRIELPIGADAVSAEYAAGMPAPAPLKIAS